MQKAKKDIRIMHNGYLTFLGQDNGGWYIEF